MQLVTSPRLCQTLKLFVSVLLVMMLASCAGKTLKFSTVSGSKIKVLEWGFFNQFCQPGDFMIKITQQPEFGELERGAGKMTIGRKSTDGARMACEGRTVASKLVNYIPNEGFKGTDKMRFSVFGQSLPPRLVTVEVTVR